MAFADVRVIYVSPFHQTSVMVDQSVVVVVDDVVVEDCYYWKVEIVVVDWYCWKYLMQHE